MNHEHEAKPNGETDEAEQITPAAERGQQHAANWDPNEQVGDIYQVDLEPGQPPEIDKLDVEPPRIWVGSWLDYNNGRLHGEWIDAARDTDAVWADIAAMLAASPTARAHGEVAEDWGIFDHENFGPLRVGEQETVAYVTAVARGIAEHGPAFAAWADVMEDETSFDAFQDAYLGEYDSLEAYAEQLIDDLGYNQILDDNLPEHLRRYVEINIAALARDMWLSGDVHVYQREGGGVWLFDGR